MGLSRIFISEIRKMLFEVIGVVLIYWNYSAEFGFIVSLYGISLKFDILLAFLLFSSGQGITIET